MSRQSVTEPHATRKPRVVLQRHDQDDGSITYEIWHADLTSRICSINDHYDSERAKADAEFLVKAWNKEAARENDDGFW